MMNWTKVEPIGKKSCTNCGNTRELLAEQGDTDKALCPKCMYQQFGDQFLSEWVISVGVVAEPEVHGEVIVFEYGYGLDVSFDLKETDMPASRNPNETESIRFKKTASNRATIRFNGEKLGTVEAKQWSSFADDFLYPD